MIQAIQPYISLMRLNKPIGIFLLLWPTLIALCLASNGRPAIKDVLIFSLGVIIMRSAGCVINDYADKDFDVHVKRTKSRPLAMGQVTGSAALSLFFGLMLTGFALVLQLKPRAVLASPIGGMLAVVYPFTKRWTHYPQFILGLCFAWGIVMVYLQVQNHCSLETWILFGATSTWVLAYDTLYAMVDKIDDLKIGIKSSAIAFGDFDKVIVLGLQTLSLFGFGLVGTLRQLGIIFYTGLVMAGANMLYQQWLIQDRQPKKCFAAFLQNNYFGLFIVCGTWFSQMLYYTR